MQSWVKFSDRSGIVSDTVYSIQYTVYSLARVGCAMHEDLEVPVP